MRRAWLVALLFVACSSEPDAEIEPEVDAGSPPAATGAARWEPVRRPADVTLLEHPAHVIADPRASGQVGPPFRARVRRVLARVGQHVEEGDPIVAVVMPEVLQAAATVRGTSERIEAHRARAEELERLRREGLVDVARVFEQRTIVAELEAERARALAVLRSASLDTRSASAAMRDGSVVLSAPVSGTVRSLDARIGELREPAGEPFATIVGAGEARIEVRSPEPLPPTTGAIFESAGGAEVALGAEPIARVIDPGDGTVVTWLAPTEPVDLPDGLRGRVRLSLAGDDLWQVPSSSVVPVDGGAQVVRRTNGDFERVSVQVVATSGASSIVRGPLREDDVVAAQPSALAPVEAESE